MTGSICNFWPELLSLSLQSTCDDEINSTRKLGFQLESSDHWFELTYYVKKYFNLVVVALW